jgi:hypothetical protein
LDKKCQILCLDYKAVTHEVCSSVERKLSSRHSPIDSAIIGFSGFGSSRRFSTILRIGLCVFRAAFDETTCHLSRAPGGDMVTPSGQTLVSFYPQILRMKKSVERSELLMKCEQQILILCVYSSFPIYFLGRRKCQSDWPQKWADKPVTISHLSIDIHTFHCL